MCSFECFNQVTYFKVAICQARVLNFCLVVFEAFISICGLIVTKRDERKKKERDCNEINQRVEELNQNLACD